jgi:hypothetical protein
MTKPRTINSEGFVRRFVAFGEGPTVKPYVDLFTVDGTVQHPGMPRPLVGQEIRDFISAVLSTMPDFELRLSRWCSRGDVAFAEAQSSGGLGDRFASWPAIYCVQLRGDRVVRGRSFYDRADVFAQLERKENHKAPTPVDPATMPLLAKAASGDTEIEEDVSRRYAEAWAKPNARRIADFFDAAGSGMAPGTGPLDPEALVHHREGLFDKGTLRQRCQHYAAQVGCAFFQWELAGTVDREPFSAVAAERISLNGSKITASESTSTRSPSKRSETHLSHRARSSMRLAACEQSKGGQRQCAVVSSPMPFR